MDVVWEHYVDNVPAITAADISSIAESAGMTLPNDVIELLQSRAGQVTTPENIAISDKGHKTPFGPVLVPLGKSQFSNYTYSVFFAMDRLKEWRSSGPDNGSKYFPIATNTASGWFCLEYQKSAGAPKIVFVDTGYDPDETGAISYVADNVAGLLTKLQ